MSARSPFDLRSRKQNQLTDSTKSNNKENHNPKIVPSTTNFKSVLKSSKLQQNMPDIIVQLSELKENIANQQQQFNDAILMIRKEIDEKSICFSSNIEAIRADFEKIKASQCKCNSSHALQPIWYNKNSNETIDYLLQGMCINQVESEYQLQINQLQERINAIELASKVHNANVETNDDQCECEFKLFNDNFICPVHRDTFKESTFNGAVDELIAGLQEQMDQVCLSIRSDEEEMCKLNQKMNLLSSKFAEFDVDLDKHLYTFECRNAENIKAINNKQQFNTKHNFFAFENSATNRFMSKYNRYAHSESLRMRVEFAMIYDINKFVPELKKQFERRTGKGSVIDVEILHCISDGCSGSIHQIDLMITFNTSLSHGYLNELKFPTNWIFFERLMTHPRTNHHVKRNRTPVK